MATSTFDKEIYIDQEAAERFVAILSEPAPPRPDVSGKFRMITEEDIECCVQNLSARLLKQS